MRMYFIALIAPPDINEKVLKYKMYMKEKHRCEVALRSPAHITLVPPFWFDDVSENMLINCVDECGTKMQPFEINMTGFSHFKPRVIFIDVELSDALNQIKEAIWTCLFNNKIEIKRDERSFHPHVTIATRDLHKKSFAEAWEYFSTKKFAASWNATGISLLRHNKKNWDVVHTSQPKE